MNRTSLLTLSLGLALTLPAAALPEITPPPVGSVELIDPAALGFGTPGFTLDATWQDTLDAENGSGGIDLWELRALVPLAKIDAGSWLLGAGVNYTLTQADFGGIAGYDNTDLHRLNLQLFAFRARTTSPWWALGFVSPGIATDFIDPGSDAFAVSALGLVGYHWSDTVELAAGAYASWTIGELTAIPAVGLIWKPTDTWTVQATPPIVAIGWKPLPAWSFGLVAYPGGGSWEVGRSDDSIRQIDLTLWRTALSVEHRIGENIRINLRGGLAFGGEIEFRDSAERVLTSTDLDPAPFGALAVKWVF